MASASPAAARAVLSLYRAYRASKETADDLSSRIAERDEGPVSMTQLPSEEVSDLIQRHSNHFPSLEAGAEELARTGKVVSEEIYPGLVRFLDKELGITVEIARSGKGRETLRRFDPERKLFFTLSELTADRAAARSSSLTRLACWTQRAAT